MKKYNQTVIPPRRGWKPNTLYLVDVAYSSCNPVHRALFFSGFLDEQGQPAGYNGVMQRLPSTYDSDRDRLLSQVYYLKVVRKLVSEREWRPKKRLFMPPKPKEVQS